jgi:hypothetical protein
MPGENLNLIANPSPSELDAHGFSPYDWTTACSLFDLVPDTPLTIFYHPINTGEEDSTSANSLDGACHMCNLTNDTALHLTSPQPTQSIVRCPLPPPKPLRKKKTPNSHVSSPIGTSGHALPHKPELLCSFATYNTQSKLTPDKSDTFLPAALRTMVSCVDRVRRLQTDRTTSRLQNRQNNQYLRLVTYRRDYSVELLSRIKNAGFQCCWSRRINAHSRRCLK